MFRLKSEDINRLIKVRSDNAVVTVYFIKKSRKISNPFTLRSYIAWNMLKLIYFTTIMSNVIHYFILRKYTEMTCIIYRLGIIVETRVNNCEV
jgi:hypothetical protein